MSLPTEFNSILDYNVPKSKMNIVKKYQTKRLNYERCYKRILSFLPEALNSGQKFKILDLSTAHGGMLGVLNKYGHETVGTDYYYVPDSHLRSLNDEEHTNIENLPLRYQILIDDEGFNVILHDGGFLPYPFADNEFDITCCFQALEMYARPVHWLDIIAEFCRITKRKIVVAVNPFPVNYKHVKDYEKNYSETLNKIGKYNDHGFKCTYAKYRYFILEATE